MMHYLCAFKRKECHVIGMLYRSVPSSTRLHLVPGSGGDEIIIASVFGSKIRSVRNPTAPPVPLTLEEMEKVTALCLKFADVDADSPPSSGAAAVKSGHPHSLSLLHSTIR